MGGFILGFLAVLMLVNPTARLIVGYIIFGVIIFFYYAALHVPAG